MPLEGNTSYQLQVNGSEPSNGLSATYVNYLGAAEKVMWKTAGPVVLCMGTFGNVMTMCIFSKANEAHGTFPFYLSVLAFSDLVALWTDGLRRYIMYQFGLDFSTVHDVVCKTDRWLSFSSSFFSAWLLAAMTTQRSASMIWPHRINSLCTKRRVQIFVGALGYFALLLQSHILYGFQLVTMTIGNASTVRWCATDVDGWYYMFYSKYWYVVDFLVASALLPFLVLICSNVVLLKTVTASIQGTLVTSNAGLTSGQIHSRQKRASTMTLTLIITSLSFIVLAAPFASYAMTYQVVFLYAHLSAEKYALLNFVLSVTILIYNINFCANFYLYCLSGKTFRSEVIRVFLGQKKR